jgi:phospholipid/cholesterol/gamma-HCH transport system permease protein
MEPISLKFSRKDSDTLLISLAGDWKRENRLPSAREIEKQLQTEPRVKRILFKTENLTGWDSILVGLILAFIGAIQLKVFGAQIYVASLVGIGMVRALAAIMTGIIMAGRTGASFAAQLGTMQVNEEIDALRTLGISPMEFLVLPRMLALFLMMPLLSLYADLMGILGGLIIGVSMLDLNLMEYYNKTRESVHLNDFCVGLFSAAVFGVLVALAGCLRGMQSGRSASAVGEATTSAVVTSIVSIVVAMAVITVVCHVLNI